MSEHTPGPWVLDTIQTSVGICHRIGPFPPRRPDDETVRHACLYADYPSAFNPADKELEANARLIAAAPDLLTALVSVVESAEQRIFEDWLLRISPCFSDSLRAELTMAIDLAGLTGAIDIPSQRCYVERLNKIVIREHQQWTDSLRRSA
ncbi:hypothetical protein QVM32_08185 [Pseudomonas asiatica]|uniref:hypothetical protein n=1 Tax=Pseudomonas asiatica TaxID=2219225 RepID=UPI00352682AA